jgi:hypothetical protein
LPVEELEGRPHVLVDGAARPGSVLTLSHWPQSPTPPVLARDLSAQIVFAFVHAARGDDITLREARGRDRRRSGIELKAAIAACGRAEAVTNDHFDEDGLVSVFAMCDPEAALHHEELLVEVASCGDFGVVRSRQAARIAFSIAPIGQEAGQASDAERPGSWSGPRYRAVLGQMVELIEHTERFARYWQHDDADLEATLDDLGAGRVRIEEVPEVDLAVVTRVSGPPDGREAGGDLSGRPDAINQVALHSTTAAPRILVFDGGRCELYLRYETWVRYVSRPVPLRPDLAPLAEQLSALEPSGLRWGADGIGSLVTGMRPDGDRRTDLAPELVSRTVIDYLKSAPPAWDPFRAGGSLIPTSERRRPK